MDWYGQNYGWSVGPYWLMAVLNLTNAARLVSASVLQNLELVPFINGLKQLRVHLITRGGQVRLAFGLLTGMVETQSSGGQLHVSWDIQLTLTAGQLLQNETFSQRLCRSSVSAIRTAILCTQVSIAACGLNGGDTLFWWDGAKWVKASPTTYADG